MESKRKLTIAIPTYSRYTDLRISLLKIHKQLARLSKNDASLIHVHVQDNSSTDNTANYLINSSISNKINTTGALFTYEINKENYGFDKNVSFCIKNAISEYIWLFSDDDSIDKNAIKKVLNLLNEKFDMVNLLFVQEPFCSRLKPLRRKSYTEEIFSKESFKSILLYSKLSVFIFNTKRSKKILKKLDYSSGFIHVELALNLALYAEHKSLYSNLFVGESIYNKTNDYAPFIFNNRNSLIEKFLNKTDRYDLYEYFKVKFSCFSDPLTITLKLLIYRNLKIKNVKKSVLLDSKRKIMAQKNPFRYTNIPKLFLYLFLYITSLIIYIFKETILSFKLNFAKLILRFKIKNNILRYLTSTENLIPISEFLRRVPKPNNLLFLGKFEEEYFLNNFNRKDFLDSKLYIFDDCDVKFSEILKSREIIEFKKLNSYCDQLIYSSKFDEITNLYIKLIDFKNFNKDTFNALNIIQYLVDNQTLSSIDLLLVNSYCARKHIIDEFETLIPFIKFILVDFDNNTIKNTSEINQIIRLLEVNNHEVYFSSKIGLLPISKFRVYQDGFNINLVSILRT